MLICYLTVEPLRDRTYNCSKERSWSRSGLARCLSIRPDYIVYANTGVVDATDGQELPRLAITFLVYPNDLKTVTKLLHSDRGSQFTSHEHQHFLAVHDISCPMSALGGCYDNAAAESFFGLLKRESVKRREYVTRAEARSDVFE